MAQRQKEKKKKRIGDGRDRDLYYRGCSMRGGLSLLRRSLLFFYFFQDAKCGVVWMEKIEERVFFCVWTKGKEREKGDTEGTAGAALVIWLLRKMGKAETR